MSLTAFGQNIVAGRVEMARNRFYQGVTSAIDCAQVTDDVSVAWHLLQEL